VSLLIKNKPKESFLIVLLTPIQNMKIRFYPSSAIHILDYIIRKLISNPEITYRLRNPKYIFKKGYSELYNPEVWILE